MAKASKDTTATNKKLMIAAMLKHRNLVSYAASEVGISRDVHYEWINTDPEYKKAIDDNTEALLDRVEKNMHLHIENNPKTGPDLIKFYLKNKARHRGFTDRQEIEHSGAMPVAINVIMPSDVKK